MRDCLMYSNSKAKNTKMGKENESASKTSGDSKTSEASITGTDSARKKLKKLIKCKDTPSEMKSFYEEVRKELKAAEYKVELLEYQAAQSKKTYEELMDASTARLVKIQEERSERVKFQTLYIAMSTPEMVRTEIILFEERRRNELNLKDVKKEGLEERAISNETRAEHWKFMLKNVRDDEVRFLRRSIIFLKLFQNKSEYFTTSDQADFQNITRATGDERIKLNDKIEQHLIDKWSKNKFIEELFKFLDDDSCTDKSCRNWCTSVLDDFANMISKVFSAISEIHACTFDADECLPKEYRILKKPDYEETISVFMSQYTYDNWMDDRKLLFE